VENKKTGNDDSMIDQAHKNEIGKAGGYQKQKTPRHQREAMGPDGNEWQQNTKVDGCLVESEKSNNTWMREDDELEVAQSLLDA
jgi:hypothetical protein